MTKKKNMGDVLRVGIAGYGVVGSRRRMYIDLHPGLKTVAVCDIKLDGVGQFADGVHYFKTYKQLLEVPLDILFVCLPNYLAAEVTIAGLKQGLHVFCEKPPGKDVNDILHVMEVEKQHPDLKLKYGFNHRYHDSVRNALDIIRSKELGEVIYLRGVYGKSKIIPFSGGWRAQRKYAGGGILLDQGIHMLDLMMLFCGDFQEVKSFVSNDYWNHDVEDNVFALLKDSKGRIAELHSSATQWEHRFSLDIGLTDGLIELQGILSGSKSYGEESLVLAKKDEDSDTGTSRRDVIKYLNDNSWRDEINEFADVILEGKDVINGTSKDALETMKMVYRIYYADERWRKRFNIENPDGDTT